MQPAIPRYDEARVTPSRVAALEALADVALGKPADDALDDAFKRRRGARAMSAADKALAMELCYGVLRWRTRLDREIVRHCKKGLPEPPLLDVMRLAAYALVYLDVPPRATVSTAVDAARATKGEEAAAKFANAVLRALATDAPRLRSESAPPPGAPRKVYEEWFSFPGWLAKGFEEIAGNELPALLAACNAKPPLTLRARPGTGDALLAELNAPGEAPIARAGRFAKDGVVIEQPRGPVSELPGFREGRFTVQDEGAQLVTELLGDLRGAQLLDTCAAPGGKAIHAAQLGAHVTAVDASAKRLERVKEAAARLGAPLDWVVAEVTLGGIAALAGRTFTHVLVDAPCSATGIVRRKPDVKWSRQPADITRLAERQAAILEGALTHLAPGGRLVYAVCSLLRAEGEDVVEPFLARHPELSLVDPPAAFGNRFFRSRPDVHGTDGFFAAVVTRPQGS